MCVWLSGDLGRKQHNLLNKIIHADTGEEMVLARKELDTLEAENVDQKITVIEWRDQMEGDGVDDDTLFELVMTGILSRTLTMSNPDPEPDNQPIPDDPADVPGDEPVPEPAGAKVLVAA